MRPEGSLLIDGSTVRGPRHPLLWLSTYPECIEFLEDTLRDVRGDDATSSKYPGACALQVFVTLLCCNRAPELAEKYSHDICS